MNIGELARRTGLGPRTIRYYEGIGILPKARRLPSGYRQYDSGAVEMLLLVKGLRRLGISLKDVSLIQGLKRERQCESARRRIREVIVRKLEEIDRRIDELKQTREYLTGLRLAIGDADVAGAPADKERCGCLPDLGSERKEVKENGEGKG
jgi:MerR family copper efflux transcriptional regulator